MQPRPPLPFPGGPTTSTSQPSGAQPTYAATLSSSNKTKSEEQRRQATQTQPAHQATNERVTASQSQNSSSSKLPRKRSSAVQRIPKKNQRRENPNVHFFPIIIGLLLLHI